MVNIIVIIINFYYYYLYYYFLLIFFQSGCSLFTRTNFHFFSLSLFLVTNFVTVIFEFFSSFFKKWKEKRIIDCFSTTFLVSVGRKNNLLNEYWDLKIIENKIRSEDTFYIKCFWIPLNFIITSLISLFLFLTTLIVELKKILASFSRFAKFKI